MKVLLFVQTGDARPKCVSAPNSQRIRVNGDWWYSVAERTAQRAADRWWLVECENAERGRAYLKVADWLSANPDCEVLMDGRKLEGRILAHGGRP